MCWCVVCIRVGVGECFEGGIIISRWGSIDKSLEVGENGISSRKTATSGLKV